VSGLVAYTATQNRAMIRLFNTLPYKVRSYYEEGFLILSCRFDEPREKAPAEARTGESPKGEER
jgi:hypothetical protein